MSARGVLIALAWVCANVGAAGIASTQTFMPITPKPIPTIPAPRPAILPPVEYDKPYDGDLTLRIVDTLQQVLDWCDIGKDKVLLGCARRNGKSCYVVLVRDEVMRMNGWNSGEMLRHEIGHCNG